MAALNARDNGRRGGLGRSNHCPGLDRLHFEGIDGRGAPAVRSVRAVVMLETAARSAIAAHLRLLFLATFFFAGTFFGALALTFFAATGFGPS